MTKPSPELRGPRSILALGSLALALLGAGALGYDVFTEELRGVGWLPFIAGVIGLVASGLWRAYDDALGVEPTLRDDDAASSRGYRVKLVLGLVLLAVLVQAVVPLRYYLGDDAYDERFSWRMFSAVRMHRCELRAYDTVSGARTPVPLMRTIQAGWVTTLERNREAVMDRYLRWRCEQEGVQAATLENRCVTPEGREVPPIVREIDCASERITREGGLE